MKAPVSAVQQQQSTNGNATPAVADILQEPYAVVGDALEKKAVYLQKRIERLKQYNLDAENGVQLNQEKEDARKKLDEVEKQLEYVQFLQKNIVNYQRDFRKACKVRDVAAKKVADATPIPVNLTEALIYREILSQLGRPSVRKFFETAANGAILLTKADLAELDELSSIFNPTMEHCKSLDDWTSKVATSEAKIRDVLLEAETIVIGSKTGKVVMEQLKALRDCAYFKENRFVKQKPHKEKKQAVKAPEEVKQEEISTVEPEPKQVEEPQPVEVVELKTDIKQEVISVEFGFEQAPQENAAPVVTNEDQAPIPTEGSNSTPDITPIVSSNTTSEEAQVVTLKEVISTDEVPSSVVETEVTSNVESAASESVDTVAKSESECEKPAESANNKDGNRRGGYRGPRDNNGYRGRNQRYGAQGGPRQYRPQQNGSQQPSTDNTQHRSNGYAQQNGGYQQRSGQPRQANGYAPQNNGYTGQANGYSGQNNGYPGHNNGYAQQGNGYYNQNNGYGNQGNNYNDENGYGGNRYRNGGGRQAPTTCGFVFARH